MAWGWCGCMGSSPEASRGGQIVAMVSKAELTEVPGRPRGFSRESGPRGCFCLWRDTAAGPPSGLRFWGVPYGGELCPPLQSLREGGGFLDAPHTASPATWRASGVSPGSSALSAEVPEQALREGVLRVHSASAPRGFSQQETHWGETL